MNRSTGLKITGAAALRQSIGDILGTPLGTRLRRRNYGSRLPDMIDKPASQESLVRIYGAVATAIMRWEPRLKLQRVALTADSAKQGRWTITLSGTVDDAPVSLAITLGGPDR